MPNIPVPPPEIANDPAAVDAWYAGLSPIQRGQYLNHLRGIVAAMKPRRRRLFQQVLDRMTGSVVPGLGNWGAAVGGLTSAALQVGVSIYNSKEQAELQKDLAGESADLQRELAKIQQEAQVDAQKALIEAQTEAARRAAEAQIRAAEIAGEATIGKAQIEAQRDISLRQLTADIWSNPWVLGSAVAGSGILLIGLLRYRRKKKKKKRSR